VPNRVSSQEYLRIVWAAAIIKLAAEGYAANAVEVCRGLLPRRRAQIVALLVDAV
jgi:hypothetical protein